MNYGKSRDNQKYSFCEGINCINKNSTLVKRVYEDFLFIPLCEACLIKYDRRINKLLNTSEFLNKQEITKIYFNSIGLVF